MAALTPRNTNLSVEGAAAPANKAESKIAAPGALPPSEIDVPTMTAAETDDLLSAAAASMTFPAEPGTVTGRAASTTAGSGLTDGLRLSKKKIVPHLDISDNPSEVFVSKFSPDGALLAAGCGDGAVRVFDAETGRLNYNLNIAAHALPTTALCFRPVTETSRTRNVIISANADGSVQHWHITSGRCLHEINDPENPLFTVNYSADGKKFATGGKDFAVRVYDEATKTLVSKMEGGYHAITKGHSNRVFSLKFDKNDDNILVSGGWDNTVQIWDLRVERSVRSFYGPHVCGDAVDIYDGTILTGSYRNNDQLQLWDFGTGKLVKTIPWGSAASASGARGQACQLYAASFSPGGKLIGAGGAGINEAKIFDRTCGDALVGTVAGLSRGVYSLDFNSDGSKFVVAGGDCTVRLFSVQDRKSKA
eukprot:g4115.t1